MPWRSVSLCVGHDHKPRKTAEPIEIPSDGTLAPPVEYDESIYIDCIAFNSVLDWTEPIYAAVAVRAVAVVTAATRSMFSSVYTGWRDVTESLVRIRSPFCGYNTTQCGELKGEDLSCYSNETKSASLTKCPLWSLAYQQSVFKRYHSDKHFWEFYLQDGGKNQLAQIWTIITSLSPDVCVMLSFSRYQQARGGGLRDARQLSWVPSRHRRLMGIFRCYGWGPGCFPGPYPFHSRPSKPRASHSQSTVSGQEVERVLGPEVPQRKPPSNLRVRQTASKFHPFFALTSG